MCSTTFLTSLKHILNLLLELVKTEMQTSIPSSGFDDVNVSYISDNVKRRSKLFCTFCRKKGHTRRRCYHATKACFECGASDHFVRNCPLKTTLSELAKPFSLTVNSSLNLLDNQPRVSMLKRHADVSESKSSISSLKGGTLAPMGRTSRGYSEPDLQEVSSLSHDPSIPSLPVTVWNSSLSNISKCDFSSCADPASSRSPIYTSCSNTPGVSQGDYSNALLDPVASSSVRFTQASSSCRGIADLASTIAEGSVDIFSKTDDISRETAIAVTTLDSSFVSKATLSTSTDTTSCCSSLSSIIDVDVAESSHSLVTGEPSDASFVSTLLRASEEMAKEGSIRPLPVSSSISFNSSVTVSSSIGTGCSPASNIKSGRQIILYRNPGGVCRAGIKLAAMRETETLVGYLKRFGRCMREAFPGARQDDRRDYIDAFIAGALENHVNFLHRIKNSEYVRTSHEPLAAFVTEVASCLIPGF